MPVVTISAAMMRQLFHPCESGFITSVCRGRCCEKKDGIMVTVHPLEADGIADKGAIIKDGFIQPDARGLCPFKTNEGLCGIHASKPFGCRASPFTLNKNDKLIVRNRYRLLKCYKCTGAIPAYRAHAGSLRLLFGVRAQRIIDHLDNGGSDMAVMMDDLVYRVLKDNDEAKRGR